MEYFDRQSARHAELVVSEREIMQCMRDVEQACLQKRPLRQAFFISQLKASGYRYCAAEEAQMRAQGHPRLAERLAEHETLRNMLLSLQRDAVQQSLTIDQLEEFRTWLTEYLLRADAIDRCLGLATDTALPASPPLSNAAFEIWDAVSIVAVALNG